MTSSRCLFTIITPSAVLLVFISALTLPPMFSFHLLQQTSPATLQPGVFQDSYLPLSPAQLRIAFAVCSSISLSSTNDT